MIYDYILNTGDETISGCHSHDLGTDRLSGLDQTVASDASSFIFNKNVITGEHEISLALNLSLIHI